MMEHDASEVIGSMVLAGCKVNRWGTEASRRSNVSSTSLVASFVADVTVNAIRAAIVSRKAKRQKATTMVSSAPSFGPTGYIAATATELVLIKVDSGAMMAHLGKVVARVSRNAVASARLESAAASASAMIITLASGENWLLEAERQSRAHAEAVIDKLQS